MSEDYFVKVVDPDGTIVDVLRASMVDKVLGPVPSTGRRTYIDVRVAELIRDRLRMGDTVDTKTN